METTESNLLFSPPLFHPFLSPDANSSTHSHTLMHMRTHTIIEREKRELNGERE